jgi:hypothetical protein
VYSIIIRYNLIESGLCGKHWANVWAVLFPWVFSVPFYTGTALDSILPVTVALSFCGAMIILKSSRAISTTHTHTHREWVE